MKVLQFNDCHVCDNLIWNRVALFEMIKVEIFYASFNILFILFWAPINYLNFHLAVSHNMESELLHRDSAPWEEVSIGQRPVEVDFAFAFSSR